MKAKYVDGVLQGGAPLILPPSVLVSKADILAVLSSENKWMRAKEIRLNLPNGGRDYISPANLAARLRGMADAKEIERRYNNSGRPEYWSW